MCTASHNPKAYTGAKLVERGRDRAVAATPGIEDIRAADRGGPRRTAAAAAGSVEEVDVYAEFQDAALDVHRPGRDQAAEGRRRRRQRHGRPDGRPAARAARPRPRRPTYWTPDGNFPDHEPNPLLPENREFIIDKVVERGRRPRHRLGRRRRPLLLHRRHRRVRRRRLPHRAARRVAAAQAARARRSSTTCAPRARSPTPSSAAGGTRARQPRRPRVLQDAHARRGRDRSAARSPATTTSTTSTTPTPARSRRC